MLVTIFLAAFIKTSVSSKETPVPFDISTSDLTNLVKTKHFVDKTNIIKVFFQSTPMVMITAPRLFGKSTNMDMIKRFCEITVDEKGNRVPINLTPNYELFTTNNFKIYEDRVFFHNHFGKYPVIYLNFKKLISNSYMLFVQSFRELVREIYIEHRYLLKSSNFWEDNIDDFKQYYNLNEISKIYDTSLLNSIRTLSRLLNTHFNKTKCIVLMNDYDGPILEAIYRPGTDLIKIIDFIHKFISITIKSNTYVERGLINSCVRLAGGLNTDANNIEHIQFLANNKFSTYYGFTEDEVKLLLEKLKMSDMMDCVKDWYDGYTVENSSIKIYNPFSIVNYLQSKELKKYWAASDNIKNLEKIFLNKRISRKISDLIGGPIDIRAFYKIDIEHIDKLMEIVNKPESCELIVFDADLFVQFMTDLGYFNAFNRENKHVTVKIPNLEIRMEIERCFFTYSYFKDLYNFKDLFKI